MTQISTSVPQTMEDVALKPAVVTQWAASGVPAKMDILEMDLLVLVSHNYIMNLLSNNSSGVNIFYKCCNFQERNSSVGNYLQLVSICAGDNFTIVPVVLAPAWLFLSRYFSDCWFCLCDTDIDECTTDNGGCSSKASCSNTVGSFTCTCENGYSGDGFTCTGKSH